MLNVLQLIPTLDRSGAEKQMVRLAIELPRDRFRVEVAALTRLGPFEADLRAAGVPVALFAKRHKLDAGALWKLARWMRSRRFDVVNTWIFAANVYGRIAAHLARVPVVVCSEMAVDIWKSTGHLRLDRALSAWTTRVVGNSQAVVDFYRAAGIPAHKLTLIYSGIDPPCGPAIDRAAARRVLGIDDDQLVFVFLGRLAEQKRVVDLIDAADLLQHVEPRALTLIAGEGPLRAELEKRAASFELTRSNRVRFLGHREDAPLLIAASDALVLPSAYEGLPNVVLEAMQMNRPVIATNAPGTTELVIADETGLLVPVGKPTELCRAMRRLARDPELRVRLARAARARVEAQFRMDAMVRQYAELYEQLTSAAQSSLGSGRS